MEFNINNRVKVKLNEKGLEILKKQSEELRARLPSFPEFKPPKTDDDGFSRWQMWELMGRFGEHISLGVSVPFETTIHFDEPDEITTLRQKLEQAEARADACQLQAQIWKQEARAQSSTVAEIYQELTGKTGQPGDWNGVRPLKPAILRKQAEAVDEVNRLLTTISEEVESGAMDACLVMQYAASTAGEEANRLRQQADEAEKAGGEG